MTSKGGLFRALARLPRKAAPAVPAVFAGLVLWACCALLLLAGCNFINSVSGPGGQTCGTQVGDPDEVLAGCVNDEDGNPAIAATVVVYKSNSSGHAKAMADSVLHPDSMLVHTNQYGRYSISNGLLTDDYDILIQSDTTGLRPDGSAKPDAAALKTKVRIDAGGHLWLDPQKLLPRTNVRSRVIDNYGSTVSGAHCSDPSGRFTATTDETGWFNLSLPKGRYTLTCSHSPLQSVTRDSISVLPNRDLTLDPPMELNSGDGNTAPALITAKYDPVTGIVHLTWPKTPFSGFFQYEVKRDDVNKLSESIGYSTKDTVFDDLVYKSRGDRDSTVLYYNVVIRTNTRFNDWAQSTNVPVKPPKLVGPDIELGYKIVGIAPDKADSILIRSDSVFAVGDTARFLARYLNHFRANTKVTWVAKRAVDDTFSWMEESSEVRNILTLSGSDTLSYACLVPGKIEIDLTIEDEKGTSNSVSLRFQIAKPQDPGNPVPALEK